MLTRSRTMAAPEAAGELVRMERVSDTQPLLRKPRRNAIPHIIVYTSGGSRGEDGGMHPPHRRSDISGFLWVMYESQT